MRGMRFSHRRDDVLSLLRRQPTSRPPEPTSKRWDFPLAGALSLRRRIPEPKRCLRILEKLSGLHPSPGIPAPCANGAKLKDRRRETPAVPVSSSTSLQKQLRITLNRSHRDKTQRKPTESRKSNAPISRTCSCSGATSLLQRLDI